MTRKSMDRHLQSGITLIETLVAILLMAFGIIGILGSQLRTLNDAQTSLRRAQAVRLIEDLSERLRINPNAMSNISRYRVGWADNPKININCDTKACTSAQLAQFDIARWKSSVTQLLPGGNATVFYAGAESVADNRRQLGVMLSWRKNEIAHEADVAKNAYIAPIDTSSATTDAFCEVGHTCHLQYITVSARCAPFINGSTIRYYCPG